MKREIKFRGKRVDTNQWIVGGYTEWENIKECPRYAIIAQNGDYYDVDPDTVGQFTGLCDKHGKEVYEGDIVKIDTLPTSRDNMQVTFRAGSFMCDKVNYLAYELWRVRKDCTVIGNVTDNPELLKK